MKQESRPVVSPAVTGDFLHYIDSSKLRPGDILLCTDPDGRVSKIIRRATGSRYSHAAIFIGDGEFVEAVGLGVRRFMVESTAVRNRENVRFLRLKNSVLNAVETAQAAARKAENYVARRYWVQGAIAAGVRGINLKSQGKFFCSQLVAQAYREAGLELLVGVNPHKVMPGRLLDSAHLVDITDDVLLPAVTAKRWRPADLLDGKMRATIHDGEIAVRQTVNDRINALLRSEGVDTDGGLEAGLKFLWQTKNDELRRRLDPLFVDILREEGYVELTTAGAEKHIDIYQMPHLIDRMIEANEPPEKFAEMLAQLRTHQRYLRQRIDDEEPAVRKFNELADSTGCEVFQIKGFMTSYLLRQLNEVGLVSTIAIATLEEHLQAKAPRS